MRKTGRVKETVAFKQRKDRRPWTSRVKPNWALRRAFPLWILSLPLAGQRCLSEGKPGHFRHTALWEMCMTPLQGEGRTDLAQRGTWRWLWCMKEGQKCSSKGCWCSWCPLKAMSVRCGGGSVAERTVEGWLVGSRARGSPLCYRPVGSSRSLPCLEAPHKISPDAIKKKKHR